MAYRGGRGPPPARDDAESGPRIKLSTRKLTTENKRQPGFGQGAATTLPRERLAHLARKIHRLGERPLCELFRELDAGANLQERLEKYAALEPLSGFIAARGGDRLPPARPVKGRP